MSAIPDLFAEQPLPVKNGRKFSPFRILASLAILIYLAEMCAMIFLYYFQISNYAIASLIDGFIMLVLIMPALYFLQLRPLSSQIKERTQAELALQAGEKLLKQVLELLPVGVWIIDSEGKIIHGNPASHRIWAGARYVDLGRYGEYKAWWVDSGERIQTDEWAASRAIANGESILEEEVEIESFDGEHKIILNSAVPLVDEHNLVTGAIVVNQDITARKKIARDLQQSEELFRTAIETLPVGVWLADASGKIMYGNPAGRKIWAGAQYVGIEQFGEYKGWWVASGKRIEPDDWAIARAIRNQETSLNEEIEIECFDGTRKFILNSAIPLYGHNKSVTGAFVVNQDITEQKRSAERLFRQNEELRKITASEQKQRLLAEALAEAIVALNTSFDLEQLVNILLDRIALIIPSDTAGVTLFDDQTRQEVQVLRGYQEWAGRENIPSVHIDGITDSLVHRLATSRKSVTIPNLENAPGDDGQANHQIIRSWLVIPLIASDKIIGIVELGKDEVDYFDAGQSRWAEVMVGQAAVVIQNVWLYEQVRSNSERLQLLTHKLVEVQENERAYVARELHDEAGQALSTLKLNLSRLEQDPDCPVQIAVRLREFKGATDGILEELHRLAMDLRPAALDHLGLSAALQQYIQNLSSEQLTVQFKAVGFGSERLPKNVEITLYRIVQEALTNVLRHAAASSVGILLEKELGKVKLFIEDNGIGIELDLIEKTDRMGLVSMRERAEMLGGSLIIESSPGCGTTIVVEVPDGDPNSHR